MQCSAISHGPPTARHTSVLGSNASAGQLVEALSEREVEVLQMVAAGMSNKEIANELILAVSTVKRHMSNVYGKLNVNNRTQAVARARDLHLL